MPKLASFVRKLNETGSPLLSVFRIARNRLGTRALHPLFAAIKRNITIHTLGYFSREYIELFSFSVSFFHKGLWTHSFVLFRNPNSIFLFLTESKRIFGSHSPEEIEGTKKRTIFRPYDIILFSFSPLCFNLYILFFLFIDLSDNLISSLDFVFLEKMLHDNTTLLKIDFSQNLIGFDFLYLVLFCLCSYRPLLTSTCVHSREDSFVYLFYYFFPFHTMITSFSFTMYF